MLGSLGLDGPTPTGPTLAVTPAPMSPYEATPRLLGLPRVVLLDSSSADDHSGRYSYLSADPFLTVCSRGRRVELTGPAGRTIVEADPFELLRCLLSRYFLAQSPGLPPFLGGAVGYFGYDLGRLLESLPATNPADGALPELDVGFYDWVLAADHLSGENWLVATGLPAGTEKAARARLAEIESRLDAPAESSKGPEGSKGEGRASDRKPLRFRSNVSRADYLGAVRRAKAYIAAGDIYQVNLSHRLEGEWRGSAWSLYERLRAASPVSYGAYLDLGDGKVLSASPELFLRLDGGRVQTRPIKGTRPRGKTPEEDRMLGAQLRSSEKDRAENLMIVDLLRNDLGKACRVGSVHVPELFGIEGYSTVWQMVSTVRGELRSGLGAVDLLRACFPGGSVTGCPKIRAMEIIEELEPVRRGVYCGSIGYLSFSGSMGASIVIRTLVLRRGKVHLQVGGAIVSDSDPGAEYEETLAKSRAAMHALGTELEEW
ncbi:Para-aminobenzoate synthase, aminase component [uncultured Rubrobacteraceae bacterium]|uniref:aminodeoxychorismate synthase n=1 Tax=uncultured Rubrobacteraceae bacterium TaxID=349277 RepID=A0A6J4QQX7_9ACTN|nr:Para-aminobenzoate synthase, aminase component [uncultured Rubrobacteraceae bacterium]